MALSPAAHFSNLYAALFAEVARAVDSQINEKSAEIEREDAGSVR